MLLVVVVVVLALLVEVTTILVHVVVHCLLVNFEAAAFECFLEVELVLVVVIAVSALLILTTVVKTLLQIEGDNVRNGQNIT